MIGPVVAVIVAAGKGTRFGKPYNKIFHRLDGETVLSRCVRALARAKVFDGIYCVTAPQERETVCRILEEEGTLDLIAGFADGGETRTQSVRNGLSAIPRDTHIVAIHDAARCFVPEDMIRACVESAGKWGSGVPATTITDTVKFMQGDAAYQTLDRNALCCVQTPQTFRYSELMQAYERFDGEVTDDASVYEACFGEVRLVKLPSCRENTKITLPEDGMNMTGALRIGSGYDAHRLVEGRKLILCGVEIPYARGLLGHSDADVAAHALMDALLGAAGLGDIGKLFPDSDAAYKDICSLTLLERVMEKVRSCGYRVRNCDITIVAQRPKLMPYREEMRSRIAKCMNVDPDQVSIKATTTEGMGFEGEMVGISASAVVLLG